MNNENQTEGQPQVGSDAGLAIVEVEEWSHPDNPKVLIQPIYAGENAMEERRLYALPILSDGEPDFDCTKVTMRVIKMKRADIAALPEHDG